jgi:hypothetical protein
MRQVKEGIATPPSRKPADHMERIIKLLWLSFSYGPKVEQISNGNYEM